MALKTEFSPVVPAVPAVRILALFALMVCAPAAVWAAQPNNVSAAVAALKSNVTLERLEALHFLGAQRAPEAYKVMAAHFQKEKDPYLRIQLVEMLDVQLSTWAYSCTLQAADDTNGAVRQAAVSALATKAGDPRAERKLRALAADPSDAVRMKVVNSLSIENSTAAVSIIGEVLSDQKGTPRARRFAAGALSRMKRADADAELSKHETDTDPEIKAAVAARRRGAKPNSSGGADGGGVPKQ